MPPLEAFKAEMGCVGVSQGYLSSEKNEELACSLRMRELTVRLLARCLIKWRAFQTFLIVISIPDNRATWSPEASGAIREGLILMAKQMNRRTIELTGEVTRSSAVF